MLMTLGTGLLLPLMARLFFMQASMVANPQLIRATKSVQGDKWLVGVRK